MKLFYYTGIIPDKLYLNLFIPNDTEIFPYIIFFEFNVFHKYYQHVNIMFMWAELHVPLQIPVG